MANTIQMKKPKVLILGGYGLNCDYETYHAFELAGGEPEYVHINELIFGKKKMSDYHILAVIGGFAYGDDLGAGVVLANKLKNNLWPQLQRFISAGKLIIGICNGFQALVKAGLLPALEGFDKQTLSLVFNDSGKYEDRWISIKINPNSPCIWTKGIVNLEVPVRHGEGKFVAEDSTLKQMVDRNLIVAQYTKDGKPANGSYPENPNGSVLDIAAVCDPTGRIFGLMPHPEAFNHICNHPNWTLIRELARRSGKPFDLEGPGIQVFRNAVDFAKKELL